MQEKNIHGHLVAVLVVIIWGTTFVNSKVLLNRGISPDEIFLCNMLFLGFVASTLGFISWNWALRVIGTVKATNYVYFQSSVTQIVASIVLGETITPMAVGGVLLLIGGMVLAQRKQRLQTKLNA